MGCVDFALQMVESVTYSGVRVRSVALLREGSDFILAFSHPLNTTVRSVALLREGSDFWVSFSS